MLEIDSPILEIPDVNSYNLYFGWYLGDLEQNEEFFDEYHEKYPIVRSDFPSTVQTPIRSTNPHHRKRETTRKVIRQSTMNIC